MPTDKLIVTKMTAEDEYHLFTVVQSDGQRRTWVHAPYVDNEGLLFRDDKGKFMDGFNWFTENGTESEREFAQKYAASLLRTAEVFGLKRAKQALMLDVAGEGDDVPFTTYAVVKDDFTPDETLTVEHARQYLAKRIPDVQNDVEDVPSTGQTKKHKINE
ncbi:MAG TPA: hypothetical protein VJ508_19665 [Saprospiraceae bacterium]|nr:hypothetical protein [Saprospiraceae bacterium]